MTNERKASEVILSIEAQNEQLLGIARTINHKLSLALNRMNLHDAVAQAQPSAPTPVPPSMAPTPPPTVEAFVPADDVPSGRPVRQQVVYSVDGKPVPIAKVRVYDAAGELIKETRTGPSGKWNAQLKPGDYGVHVTKSKVRTYPLVNVQSEFTVMVGSEPQILERIEIS